MQSPEAEVAEAVKTLAEIFSRRLSDSALALWVELLAEHHGPELLRTLRDACKQPRMPGPGEILETTMAAKRRNAQMQSARVSFEDMAQSASTPEAKAAAERAMAIMREKFGM